MPDRQGRKPIGTLTRHPADFYSDFIYVAGRRESNQPAGPGLMYNAFGVFNDDQEGRVMRVYGATSISEGGSGMAIFMPKGTIGAQVDVARSIRPDRGAPSISVWSEHQQTPVNTPNPFDFGPQFGEIASDGFDSATIVSPFPLFIVPQGFSLVATDPQSSFETGMFWWFQMAAQ